MAPPRTKLASISSSVFSIGRARGTREANAHDSTGSSTPSTSTLTSGEPRASTLTSSPPTKSLLSITRESLSDAFSFSPDSKFSESKLALHFPYSTKAQTSSPAAVFRQHLARKASTLRLKIRRRKTKKRGIEDPAKVPQPAQNQSSVPAPPSTPDTVLPTTPVQPLPRSSTLTPSNLEPIHLSIRSKQQQRCGEIHKSQSVNHTFVRMASESAQPPVTYSHLQQITTSACEKALGSITSYNHASTEDWNTTIINTILGTLVQETTPQSNDGQAQPPFKFVVNSTIIQHAPGSSSSSADPALTGRRGMHAASGAFWSNEKDGMWSYKYSAAENKGFDVVVGIIWIWVG